MKKLSLFLLILLTTQSCKVSRFAYCNFANITDHKIFPARTLLKCDKPYYFEKQANDTIPLKLLPKGYDSFEDYLKKNKTVSFLIIQNDSIKYENYFNKYNDSSVVASFSMAKSVTSMLVGCAIDDGLIQSVNDQVTKYIPELKKNGFDKVTIEHLLQMTSGLDFNESYFNPFGDAATFYYGRKLEKNIIKLKLKAKPGTQFEYNSGNPQILGLILQRVLKNKSITSYLQEKIWSKIGMQYNASWSLDRKNGLEKTFCCINARAIDFAKLGKLFMQKGKWNGKQIVPESWVQKSTSIDISNGSVAYYQYQWWLPTKTGDFMAQGILGQFIYVNPNKNLIIVRLGENYGKTDWESLFVRLANFY